MAASDVSLSAPPRCGSAPLVYVPDPAWSQVPRDLDLVEIPAVSTDANDNVFAFSRGPGRDFVVVLDANGKELDRWGEGSFVRPHGITVAPDGAVWCCDDLDHSVKKFSPTGELLMVLGTPGRPSDTGAVALDYRQVRRSAGPFNYPTNLAVGPDGCLFITDGYGNARVHVFAPDGRLIRSWGDPGTCPGQFQAPHGIAVDADGTVYVCDRENSRIQRFTSAGELIDIWTDVARPCQVFIDDDGHVYVAELGFRAGLFPGDVPPPGATAGGRVSIFTRAGERLCRWGGGDDPCALGDFFAPHDIWVDRRGDIYVSEVVYYAGIMRGAIGPESHTLQKFIRVKEPATT